MIVFRISQTIQKLIALAVAGFIVGLAMVGGLSVGFWLALWSATS